MATRDAVQRLVAELFERCPSVPCENGVGRIATLPEPVIQCPREKPVRGLLTCVAFISALFSFSFRSTRAI